MPRPIWLAAAFTTGTVLLLQWPTSGGLALLFLPGVIAIVAAWLRAGTAAWLLACVAAGACWSGWAAGQRVYLDQAWHNTDHVIDARITSLVTQRGQTISFTARASVPGHDDARIALRWYDYGEQTPRPLAGERWRLTVRLRRPRGLHNPGDDGFERFVFRERLYATGYVRNGENLRIATSERWHTASLRDRLSRRLYRDLGHCDTAPLVIALALGDRQYLDPEHWLVLRRTGLAHLVAISGLHIGMVAFAAYAVLALAGSLAERGIGAGCLGGITAAVLYATLAGMPLPTRRALIVVTVILVTRALRRPVRTSDNLALAMLLVVVVDPLATMSAAFWLSFGAVAVIVYATSGALGVAGWRSIVQVQWAVTLGLAPALVVWFGEVSLLAPVVNVVAVPLTGLLIVPLVLTGTMITLAGVDAGVALLRLVCKLLSLAWTPLQALSEAPVAIWKPGPVPAAVACLSLAGMLWLLAPRGWPRRSLGLVMALALAGWRAPPPAYGAVELTLLDVGHGTAAVVRTHRHVLIYDTGPRWRSGRDAGERIVLPYLSRLRVRGIDRIIVSHADNDHAGGLASIGDRFPGAMTQTGEALRDNKAAQLRQRCRAGQRWFWDGVAFTVLHPDRPDRWSGNNASCVVRIDAGNHCLLLTGDIEREAERALLRSPSSLRCDVVVAPHHGSETSSGSSFIAATGADYVLFSTAFGNRWGLPRASVVERWRDSGAYAFDTGRDGAIVVSAGHGQYLRIHGTRCKDRRLWTEGCENPASGPALGRH